MVQMPDMLNWFGWCTWDAFYTDVNAEEIKQGLERYEAKQCEVLSFHSFSIT